MPKLDDLSLIRQLRADQDAYQQMARALEMQRTFVADVSHELRTPLTTLRGNLGLLARRPPIPAEEQSDILSDMTDESDRLIRLVNALLTLAHADAGRRLARLFERFYRGADSLTLPGFGLGPPIAKALVEGMGGTISLVSEAGKGSRLSLRLSAA